MLNAKLIGDRITAARKNLNISQAQLAEQLFISAQAVGKWERGESMPDIITLIRLAEILKVDLNYFADGSAPGRKHAIASEAFPEVKSIVSTSDAISSEKLKKSPKWDMSRGNWVDADFSGLKNLHEKFSSSNMQRCKFIGSDLSGILLSSNNVTGCDFSQSSIDRSQINGSHFAKNNFEACNLKETEFSGSHIHGCNFNEADFSGVKLKSGGFEKNTMINSVLNNTSFNAMYLADLNLTGRIEDCSFENCAFKRVTFQNATLINTFFKCGKLKGITFIDCQADRMTYEFLKNGKADLKGVSLIES